MFKDIYVKKYVIFQEIKEEEKRWRLDIYIYIFIPFN